MRTLIRNAVRWTAIEDGRILGHMAVCEARDALVAAQWFWPDANCATLEESESYVITSKAVQP